MYINQVLCESYDVAHCTHFKMFPASSALCKSGFYYFLLQSRIWKFYLLYVAVERLH